MNTNRCVAAFAVAMSCFAIACDKGASAAQQGAAAAAQVDGRGAPRRGGANGPFEFAVTGSKAGNASGNDASFCVSTGSMQVFVLSQVASNWAVSITALGALPAVGSHALGSDPSAGLMAELIDKTTGPNPPDWVHHKTKSGSLTLTRSDSTKLEGTYELIAAPSTGGELRAKGKFEANPVRC